MRILYRKTRETRSALFGIRTRSGLSVTSDRYLSMQNQQ